MARIPLTKNWESRQAKQNYPDQLLCSHSLHTKLLIYRYLYQQVEKVKRALYSERLNTTMFSTNLFVGVFTCIERVLKWG